MYIYREITMKRAIGVIDSGVGGLTVLHELMRQLPQEHFIYFGDTLRCPYGSKTKEQVKLFIWQIVNYLLKKKIKSLVIACNTATAYTIKELQSHLSIPVIGVIKPGARAAIKVTKNKEIGVIGTQGTVQSGAYSQALSDIDPTINTYSLPCPRFVPMIEQGLLQGEEVDRILTQTLYPLLNTEIDTLILGCTHYPLIKKAIHKLLGDSVRIVSSGEEVARETSSMLDSFGLTEISTDTISINHEFYTTGELKMFTSIAKLVFNGDLYNLKEVKFQKAILT